MTMFLAGGGSPAQESLVWAEAFRGAARALFWPFALPDDRIPDAAPWFRDALLELSVDARPETWGDLAGHHPRELAGYDLLFVGGGTTSRLVTHVLEHGFAEAVGAFVVAGGTYYGSSAGALLVCDQITVASQLEADPQAAGMPGLGLVPGLSVFPHADLFPPERPAELARLLGHDVLTLPEASGVAVVAGTVRAIGPGLPSLVTAEGTPTRTLPLGEPVALEQERPCANEGG